MVPGRPPAALVLKGRPEDCAESWQKWLKEFKVYLNTSGLYRCKKVVQAKFLMKYIGPVGQNIYSSFKTKGQNDDIDILIQKFDEHFGAKTSTTMARFYFFTRTQKEGENIDAYVTSLRVLSQGCEFDHLEESLIRDRIICGLIDSSISYKLLEEVELTLEKAVEICKANEVSNEQSSRGDLEERKSLEISGEGVAAGGSMDSGSMVTASKERQLVCKTCGGTPQLHDPAAINAIAPTMPFPENNKSTKAEAPAVCNSCNSVINGRIVTALNKKWHPEHFTCNTCRKPIDGAKFHQHDGGVHCVPCFAAHHSPRCHGCGDPITDRVIQALGVSWHANHFVCGGCRKELGGGGFMEQAGRPYCSACYADKFAARCKGCGSPITDKAIIALDAKWHRDCFTCMKCRNPVTDATFSVMDNKPLCGKCA